jgi:MazG family protein
VPPSEPAEPNVASTDSVRAAAAFARLVEIMARLRSPEGCPWDREQTFDTIKPYLLEESYEVMDAIDARDWKELPEELGDLLLQVVFFSQMASEAGHFSVTDALEAINAKLIRRHPHVFAGGDAKTAADVTRKWDEIKAAEKPRPKGLLSGVPRSLPALVEAAQISRRAAGAGFDWPDLDQVIEKVCEELTELESARQSQSPDAMESEIGDLLFTIVNVARFLQVDPEQALRRSNAKFRERFAHVERSLESRGKTLQDATLDEMEALWQAAKQQEKSQRP